MQECGFLILMLSLGTVCPGFRTAEKGNSFREIKIIRFKKRG
jgi:hypothetical protein